MSSKIYDDNLFDATPVENQEISMVPIMSIEGSTKLDKIEIPKVLPTLILRDSVLFPGTIMPVRIGREKSLTLIENMHKKGGVIGTVTQIDTENEDITSIDEFYKVGTAAKILKIIDMKDKTLTVILQGIRRFEVENIIALEPYHILAIKELKDIVPNIEDERIKALEQLIKEKAQNIIANYSPHFPPEAEFAIRNIDSFEFLVNFVALNLDKSDLPQKMAMLAEGDLEKRAYLLVGALEEELNFQKIKNDIQEKVKNEMDQQQREFYLNNQLKTIQEELGMSGSNKDIADLEAKAKNKKWPKHALEAFKKGINKLEQSNPNTPDYYVEFNYLDLLVGLPWEEQSEDNLDLDNAQNILDKDHYGLEKIKERIIEYLAVLKLKKDFKSPILCLWGPPGTGKTSLGISVAKALGRKYQRISLGGLNDEAEIRGHRKTYIGAMPGRIIQAINRAGTSNPVIVLDEIDKVVANGHGDPSSALLEVLDPEQNSTFHDNYLDIDYDISNVLFITTANNISTIQPALKDRMEMIDLSGYLAEEKFHIAKDHLIKKQTEAHGLTEGMFGIEDDAIMEIIDNYTRESGVRQLDKRIAKIARKVALKVAKGEKIEGKITLQETKDILGLPTNTHDLQEGNEFPGVVTGLAWTEMGGEILFVECSKSEGKGNLSTTGNLGDVMKESATIAYQYLKANSNLIGMSAEEFKNYDLHIHVPEGAIPKDGPSAGITMVSAMASALMNKRVKSKIAMTGEMTLRGKVLPVGGIKEKILAAKRAGVSTIILSEENRKDIEDIKKIYIEGLEFVYVKTMAEVLNYIFS